MMEKNDLDGLSPDDLKTLEILAAATGAGFAVCGALALLEGYETGDEARKRYGLNLLLSGGNVARMTPQQFGAKLARHGGSDRQ